MSLPRDPLERFFGATLRINHLRTLAALAQLGQLRRVAEAFHVTQSAISKQIAEIEAGLGEAVLRREGNAVVLTPIGQRLALRATDILEQLERTRHEIAALRVGLSGRIVLGAVATVTAWLVPQAIRHLKARAPGVAFSLEEGTAHQLLRRLAERSIDLAVVRMWQPIAHEGLSSRILMDEAMVIAVGARHLMAPRKDLSWEELMDCSWIIPRAGSAAHAALAALMASHGLAIPEMAVESISVTLNLALLASGDFVCLLPRYLASDLAAEGRVAILPLDTAGLLSETRVFWRNDDHDATRSLVLDCLVEVSQQTPPSSV
jgi:DNA-binding transcriptional LysR family regulator